MVGRSILNSRGIDPCDPSSLVGIGCTPLEDGSACGAQVLSCFDGIDVRVQERIFRLGDANLICLGWDRCQLCTGYIGLRMFLELSCAKQPREVYANELCGT